MSYKTLLLFLFFSTIVNAQELKDKLEKDVCKCLNEIEEIEIKSLISCFSNSMANYEEELEKLIDKDSPLSEYQQGRLLGKQLFSDIQVNLVHDCDVYYNFFQRSRKQSILDMQDFYTKQVIDSIDSKLAENKSIDLLLERGNAFFVKNQLEEAKEQYYECLNLDSNHAQTNFFLGWVKETEGNYQEAIELYKKVYSITQRREILLFAELAKRKSTE